MASPDTDACGSSPKVSIPLILNAESTQRKALPPRLPPPSLLSRHDFAFDRDHKPFTAARAPLPSTSPQQASHFVSPAPHPQLLQLLHQHRQMPMYLNHHESAYHLQHPHHQQQPQLPMHQIPPHQHHHPAQSMGLPMGGMGVQTMLTPYPMMHMANYGYNPYPTPASQVVVSPSHQLQPQNKHRRFRRRYYQIHRKYNCTFAGCTKSYGLLNHLNTHIVTKKHGLRKSKSDFKHAEKDDESKDDDNDASSSTNSTTTPSTEITNADIEMKTEGDIAITGITHGTNAASDMSHTVNAVAGTVAPDTHEVVTKKYASESLTDMVTDISGATNTSTHNETKIVLPPPKWTSGSAALTLPSISASPNDGPIKLPSLPSVVGRRSPLP